MRTVSALLVKVICLGSFVFGVIFALIGGDMVFSGTIMQLAAALQLFLCSICCFATFALCTLLSRIREEIQKQPLLQQPPAIGNASASTQSSPPPLPESNRQ